MLSVSDDAGVHTVVDFLLSSMSSSAAAGSTWSRRWAAVVMLRSFCERSRAADITDYTPQLLRAVIHITVDTDQRLLHAAWDCLDSITKVHTL